MGVERFREDFRNWIQRAFRNRAFILGKSKRSREPLPSNPWPNSPSAQRIETFGRIYDIYAPSSTLTAKTRKLEEWTRVPALDPHIVKIYPFGGSKGYDSDYLNFVLQRDSGRPPWYMGRIYVNYDIQNRQHASILGRYLKRELWYGTRGISQFKMAGPLESNARRDSAVIYLDRRGLDMREELARSIANLIPLTPRIPYGACELAPGIGYALDPRHFKPSEWQSCYGSSKPSFGSLLTIYIARALQEAPGTLEAFSDRLADLFQSDGIDPQHLHRLSDTIRFDPDRLRKPKPDPAPTPTGNRFGRRIQRLMNRFRRSAGQ